MTTAPIGRGNTFGGDWTEEKLGILEAYLDAYTTALKNKPFRLVYVDAFAGTGWVKLDSGSGHETDREDRERLIAGSAERALRVTDRPFDRLVFVESDPERYEDLCGLREHHPDRGIDPRQDDANSFLCGLSQSEYGNWRGVLFIDPFGTQVAWRTLEHVAELARLDTWILFPAGAVARMLPRSRKPDDVDPKWAKCLNTVFGDDRWQSLYSAPAQHDLFGQCGPLRATLSSAFGTPGPPAAASCPAANHRDRGQAEAGQRIDGEPARPEAAAGQGRHGGHPRCEPATELAWSLPFHSSP